MLRPCQDLAQPFAAFLDLDRRLVPDIFDIALKKVGDLFHRRAKRETVPEFGEINRGPWPFMLRLMDHSISAMITVSTDTAPPGSAILLLQQRTAPVAAMVSAFENCRVFLLARLG
jgi:hypothetical protein